MIYINNLKYEIGNITIASDGKNLIGLWLESQTPSINLDKAILNKDLPIFIKTKQWLDEYFIGKNPKIKIPIKLYGTQFRKDVWEILKKIPYGETITYGDIAKELEQKYQKKTSARAVGGAVGHNPISIIIPCHRVIGTNNNLTGYAGGLDKKILLMKKEKMDTSKFKFPKK